SVRRQIEFHERFIRELLKNQRLLSSGDYRRLLALEDEAEASSILQNLPAVEATAYRTVELAKAAAEDLERFREMARLVEPIRAGNDPKIAKLVELIRARPGRKIVVFSNFQDTVRYIDKALKEAYAEDLKGLRWEVVDGQVDPRQRTATLRCFAPRSQKAQIPPEEE
ncbi:MAG: hypothetical protein N2578_10495, partial [Bdellovibrionaceae bacterium]|nr:hypothetical protein [Pseudobdellovibrionaceae bacterium]